MLHPETLHLAKAKDKGNSRGGDYLCGKSSIHMHVNAKVVGGGRAEEGDIEEAGGYLHHGHLLMEVGRHGLLAEDHHTAGGVDSQQVPLGTPLQEKEIASVCLYRSSI